MVQKISPALLKGWIFSTLLSISFLLIVGKTSAQSIDTASIIFGIGTGGHIETDVVKGNRIRSFRLEPYILKQLSKKLYVGAIAEYQFVRSNIIQLGDSWGIGLKARYYLPVLKKEQDRMRVAAEVGYHLLNNVIDPNQEANIRFLDCLCAHTVKLELIGSFKIWKSLHINGGVRYEIGLDHPNLLGPKIELEYQLNLKRRK